MSGYIKEFVTDFVVMRDDQATCDAAKCVCHPKCSATSIAVALEV